MKLKIIHYSKLKERLDNLIPALQQEGINYSIVSVFDPEKITKIEFEKFDRTKLKDSEISCFLKHLYVLTTKEDNDFIIILEDDAILVKRFRKKLISHINKLPKDFGFLFFDQITNSFKVKLNLLNFYKKIHIIDFYEKPNFNKFSNKKSGKTRGMAGYVFNTEFSEAIRDEFEKQNKITIPIDHWLNHFINKYSLKIFWSQPPLSNQGSKSGKYESQTETD